MDLENQASSSAYHSMESSEFEPAFMGHSEIDPALTNGSSTESSYFDNSSTGDLFVDSSPDESVSPPMADPTVDQPEPRLLAPPLDPRMDLYSVPGGMVPTTAGLEEWIAGFDTDYRLMVFQVIGKLSPQLRGVGTSN